MNRRFDRTTRGLAAIVALALLVLGSAAAAHGHAPPSRIDGSGPAWSAPEAATATADTCALCPVLRGDPLLERGDVACAGAAEPSELPPVAAAGLPAWPPLRAHAPRGPPSLG